MKYVYVLFNGGDPEDMVIFLSNKEAIDASIKYPDMKVQVYQHNLWDFGYRMAYMHYKNGILYESS